jgi:hypothetical protein
LRTRARDALALPVSADLQLRVRLLTRDRPASIPGRCPETARSGGKPESAYAASMDELVIDRRRTQLLAVDASLTDAGRALLRASRIPSDRKDV